MTLAVARIVGNRIALVADTLLTEHDMALPHQKGVIKLCLLPGDICVGICNSAELAQRDFINFSERYPLGAGFSDVIHFFAASSAKYCIDYIIAFSRIARIIKIANGRRVSSLSKTLWIGDKSAYEEFRNIEGKNRKRTEAGRALNAVLFMDELPGSQASELHSVMRELIMNRRCSTVRGFVSVVSNRDPGFRHSVYCDMLFDWPVEYTDEFVLNLNDQLDFGASGENASYAVAQISTGYFGINIFGYYLLRARKAVLFVGRLNGLATECVVVNDVDPPDLANRLTQVVEGDLGWLLTIAGSSPLRGATKARQPLLTQGPSGVGIEFFVHANTFPPTSPLNSARREPAQDLFPECYREACGRARAASRWAAVRLCWFWIGRTLRDGFDCGAWRAPSLTSPDAGGGRGRDAGRPGLGRPSANGRGSASSSRRREPRS